MTLDPTPLSLDQDPLTLDLEQLVPVFRSRLINSGSCFFNTGFGSVNTGYQREKFVPCFCWLADSFAWLPSPCTEAGRGGQGGVGLHCKAECTTGLFWLAEGRAGLLCRAEGRAGSDCWGRADGVKADGGGAWCFASLSLLNGEWLTYYMDQIMLTFKKKVRQKYLGKPQKKESSFLSGRATKRIRGLNGCATKEKKTFSLM